MTQKILSVSPLIPACPKSGATAPAFRPADQGDTAALPATEEVCLSTLDPFRPFQHKPIRASVLDCGGPTSLCSCLPQAFWHLDSRPCFVIFPLSSYPDSFPSNSGANQKPEIRKSEIRTLISPAWYRIISRRTAKRNFSANRRIEPKMKP
jgi:hypothetical protein